MSPRTAKIAQLNDQLRGTFLTGKVLLTEGIAALADHHRIEIATRVREFKDFTADNDPYGEHDFGSFKVSEVGTIFWKIDYYNRTFDGGSEDPSDTSKTARVLTIMLASEY